MKGDESVKESSSREEEEKNSGRREERRARRYSEGQVGKPDGRSLKK